jgi:hypothetical protein
MKSERVPNSSFKARTWVVKIGELTSVFVYRKDGYNATLTPVVSLAITSVKTFQTGFGAIICFGWVRTGTWLIAGFCSASGGALTGGTTD